MYDAVVKKFTFAISSPGEFLVSILLDVRRVMDGRQKGNKCKKLQKLHVTNNYARRYVLGQYHRLFTDQSHGVQI